MQPPAPKVDTPAPKIDERPAISSLIQQYGQAFEQLDADALRKIWPTIGGKYDKYKKTFGMASAFRMDIRVERIDVTPDGQQATVNTSLSTEYTLKGQKPLSHRDTATFRLVKSGGVWVINDVQ